MISVVVKSTGLGVRPTEALILLHHFLVVSSGGSDFSCL